VFGCGIVPGVIMALWSWKALAEAGELPMPEVKNPTELRTAVSFGLIYAAVLLAAAWLQDVAGNSGLTSSRWSRHDRCRRHVRRPCAVQPGQGAAGRGGESR
jgi:uncharacterized membrane protein (DUF4010 family)